MLQGSWDLREPNLQLGLEKEVCTASHQGGGAVVGVSPGGRREERGRWTTRPGFESDACHFLVV